MKNEMKVKIESIFEELRSDIERVLKEDLDVKLVFDKASNYPKPRDFAMSTVSRIFVSPKMLKASNDRIRGLLMHEFSHVVLMRNGIIEHTELQTDWFAEVLFGARIYYDEEDVQTLKPGTHPRPSHLPNR